MTAERKPTIICASCHKPLHHGPVLIVLYWFAFCDAACCTAWADGRGVKVPPASDGATEHTPTALMETW